MFDLISAGLGFVADMIKDKGEDVVKQVVKKTTGIDLSNNLSEKEIEQIKANKDNITKEFQSILQDKQNAREMRTETLISEKTPLFNKLFPDILAGVSVTATFLLFYLFAVGDVAKEQKDIVLYILGLLSGITSTIFAFYFGSSKGSQDKDKNIQRIVK